MYENSKEFMPTYIIIAISIIVYICAAVLSGSFIEMDYDILRQWGQYNAFVFSGGYWQLFSAIIVHVNLIHLIGNMFFLLVFGLKAEDLFSIEKYVAIYLISGLTGNLLTLLLGPNMVSAGASGAIFGLFGACAIYIRRAFGRSIMGALMYSFFLLVITAGQGVNYLAHLGGLVTGLIIGYVFALTRKSGIVYEHKYSFST